MLTKRITFVPTMDKDMKNNEIGSTGQKLYNELKKRLLIGVVAEKAGVYRHTVRRVLTSERPTQTQTKVISAASEVLAQSHYERKQVVTVTEQLLSIVTSEDMAPQNAAASTQFH